MGKFEQKNAYINMGSTIKSKFDEAKSVQFFTLPGKTLHLLIEQLTAVKEEGADYAAVEITYGEKESSKGTTFSGGTIKAKPGYYKNQGDTASKVANLKSKQVK